jgi:hypothetical protein
MPIRKVISRSIQDGATATADLAAGSVTPAKIQTGVDFTFNTLTVGEGGGSIATNTAIGLSALAANTTGASNTGVGYQALLANTDGTQNTAVGRAALTANTSGVLNVAVGRSALIANTTGANNTALGSQSLLSNTTASNNTAVGYQAAYSNTTGTEIQAFGKGALYSNTTGNSNSAFGLNSLTTNTTASDGSAFGVNSLRYNTTGAKNTAIGSDALADNTTGSFNTALGQASLRYNTTSSNSTAVGYQAGYVSTGQRNAFFGYQAGFANTTGESNTYIGRSAGEVMTTGVNNTIIGRFSGNQGGLDIRTLSNYIVLSDGDGNPRMWMNGWGAFKNIIASGAGTPTVGSISTNISEIVGYGANSYELIITNQHPTPLSQYIVDIRFGSSSPNNTNARFLACTDNTNEKAAIYSSGAFVSRANNYGTYSDVKLKNNIVDATPKLNDLLQLKVRNFNFKDEPEQKHIGFIAQELETVFPGLVEESQDRGSDGEILETTTKTIKTSVLVPMLIKAMQEQQAIIETLKARLDAAGL